MPSTSAPPSSTAHAGSASQVALAWVATQPAVASVILGARTTDQLTDTLEAADLELTAEELAALSSARSRQVTRGRRGPAAPI